MKKEIVIILCVVSLLIGVVGGYVSHNPSEKDLVQITAKYIVTQEMNKYYQDQTSQLQSALETASFEMIKDAYLKASAEQPVVPIATSTK